MQCPYCLNNENKVIDKRDFGKITKRRRECIKCNKRFNTLENVEKPELRVIKKDDSREDFDIEKIKKGILRACEKRPVSLEEIDKAINRIEEKLIKIGKEVKSAIIGDLVSKELKKLTRLLI